ncbi:TonB-dependent receptor domain-containing protein [Rufibacter latericius]|uniref:TonB-dependent receptor n=1 Tax=Rufibacter latericius TaxID=2487040 RepID=A0A3M9MJW7_9BACT|nr:outer membrane beta-barrel family protein [Rufibacter latericius]RNI25786.1 TonB-dependent receptor [Rufibacter latericius]
MRHPFLIACLCLAAASLQAQTPSPAPTPSTVTASGGGVQRMASGKISGVVMDSTTNKPVEFATVSLVNAATGKPIDGTVTDDRGRFTLSRVAFGTYSVSVSFIGYESFTRTGVTVSDKDSEVVLGRIVLKPVQNKLKEVTVVGEKPLVEDKVDRMVYNAEQDITNIGGNASDVLKKVPSLTVDLDGNVQLRGSANVRVLINNKPSSIMANSVADALKQIPSDMIKTVEVITSPSAKYDAEGTAGIINIITKKNTMYGVNGSVSTSVGTRNSNGNANVNVRRGKVGFNASLGTHQQYNGKNESELHRITNPDTEGESTLNQLGESKRRGGGVYGQIGFDADLDSLNTVTGGVNVYRGYGRNQGLQHSQTSRANTFQEIENVMRGRNKNGSVDLNLGYTHIFKPQQELSVLAQWNKGANTSATDQDIFLNQNYALDTLLRNTNDGSNREMTFQVDYVHPFQNKTQLEIGTKGILRHAESDALYRSIRLSTEAEQLRPNQFTYDQDVYSTYASYGFKFLKNYNVKSGARFEYTNIDGQYIQPYQDPFTDNYYNFIPNILISRTIKSQTFRVGYTQRIQRPQIWYLNPYVNIIDAKNVSFGNPELEPELSHSYEFGYSNYFKTSSINLSLYWRQTNNAIESFRRVVGEPGALQPSDEVLWQQKDVAYTTYYNIGKNATYGLSFSGNTKPVPKWNIGGSFNLNYIKLQSNVADRIQSNAAMQYSVNANSGYDFGKGLAAQFFGSFSSPRPSIQGKFSGFYYSSFSVRKELWEKKGTLSIGVDNPFSKTIQFKSELANDYFLQNSINQNYNRSVRVSFSYRFGKMEMNQKPRRSKSIRNDDAKGGESN